MRPVRVALTPARAPADDPNHWNVESTLQLRERHAAHGIACDDQKFDVEAEQALGAANRVLDHRLRATRPIRNPSGVAEINEVLPREGPCDGAGHSKAPQAGVENTNRLCHVPLVGQAYTAAPKEPPAVWSLIG